MLPPQPPQPFDMYGAAAGMFQPPAPPSKTVLGSIPPPGVSGGPSFFGKMTSQHQQGEIMGQLALRDAQLRQNIAHLDKKRRVCTNFHKLSVHIVPNSAMETGTIT